MADGLDWILNRAGLDVDTITHFFHLEDDETEDSCAWCRDGAR